MKTLRRRIQQARIAGRVDQLHVERDYAQGYVLGALGETDALGDALVFKGGTALKKVHFGEYRFSENLDFSMVDGPSPAELATRIESAISQAQRTAEQVAPVTFVVEPYRVRDPHPRGQQAFTVRVQFPWQRQPIVPVKLEITRDEPVLLAAPHLPVHHGFGESLAATIRTYGLEEICAEKLRATRQTLATLIERGWSRSRARDHYDLWHLVRLPAGRIDWDQVSSILPEKCRLRDVAITSVDDVFDERLIDDVRGAWERTLGPFVSELPDIETVLADTRDRLAAFLRF